MLEVPGINGEPTLKIFDHFDEMRAYCGEKYTHGYFDPAQNLIVATLSSIAHEIGHYRDFKSGKMRVITSDLGSEERIQARIRNEIVAILFSYQRVADQYGLLPYEREFIEWVVLHWDRDLFETWPLRAPHVAKLPFPALQEFAEWLVIRSHPWTERLEVIFEPYLINEKNVLTYSRSSFPIQK